MFNGTGANVVGLQSMLPRWGAVIAASTAHINVDEGGAPERVGRDQAAHRADATDGKLTPELIDREAWGWGDEHRAQPLVVSITQSTELGTLYTADEMRAIADHAHALGMQPAPGRRAHLQRRRIPRPAAARLHARRGRRRAELRRHEERRDARARRSSCSNSRGIRGPELPAQAQHAALVEDAVRLGAADRAATRATCGCATPRTPTRWPRGCARASRRGSRTVRSRGVAFTSRRRRTASSRRCPTASPTSLRESFRFYDWDAARTEVRWMCSFDTHEADIDAFVADDRAGHERYVTRSLSEARRAETICSRARRFDSLRLAQRPAAATGSEWRRPRRHPRPSASASRIRVRRVIIQGPRRG